MKENYKDTCQDQTCHDEGILFNWKFGNTVIRLCGNCIAVRRQIALSKYPRPKFVEFGRAQAIILTNGTA